MWLMEASEGLLMQKRGKQRNEAEKLKKWSAFEWVVLALAVSVLLVMGWVYGGQRFSSVGTWRVDVERSGAPEVSLPDKEEGKPDSLLEGEVIDLNLASQADLERLPGIGQSRARAIVKYREENGPFETVEELTQVDGIGPGILERLRPYITVG